MNVLFLFRLLSVFYLERLGYGVYVRVCVCACSSPQLLLNQVTYVSETVGWSAHWHDRICYVTRYNDYPKTGHLSEQQSHSLI
jgi:hypothetical protein